MKGKKKGAEPVLSRNGLTFESALQRLEKIVTDMEEAELPLEDVLKKYEEGTPLVPACGQKLDQAEKKNEIITKKTDGTVALEPFEVERGEGNEQDSADESGKLF